MVEMYPGLLGGGPVEVDDMSGYRDTWLRDQDGSPFASAYTPSGLLKYGQPSQYDHDWSRLAPGAPVVPYVDTPTQGLLATPPNRYPGGGYSPGDYGNDETAFDPLGRPLPIPCGGSSIQQLQNHSGFLPLTRSEN